MTFVLQACVRSRIDNLLLQGICLWGAETRRTADCDYPLHLQECAVESRSIVFARFPSESLSVCLIDICACCELCVLTTVILQTTVSCACCLRPLTSPFY